MAEEERQDKSKIHKLALRGTMQEPVNRFIG
jgi:hypothetical protein